jgi:phospholipid-binding lipoprotein MlaA
MYSAVNNLLQAKPGRAAEDTMRVAINSVFGLGGLIDIATPAGLPKYKEDFGQTLGYWGLPSGPYVVLPLLGPSSVRDTAGMLVDLQLEPIAYLDSAALQYSLAGLFVVDKRSRLLGATSLLEAAALDKYSFLRDSYLQRREYLVYDGNPPLPPVPAESPAESAPPADGGGVQRK